MSKEIKLRIFTIVFYLAPILLITLFTKKLNGFLVSAGVMTVFLGLSMQLIPGYIGFRKRADKFQSPYFIVASGITLILAAMV